MIAGVAEVAAQATQTEFNYHACERYTKACNDADIPVNKMEKSTTLRGLGPLARDAVRPKRGGSKGVLGLASRRKIYQESDG